MCQKTTVHLQKFRTLSYYSLLRSYEFWKIWRKINDHSQLLLNIDQFFKEKLTDRKALPSKVEYFMTYIGNQFRSAQFLNFFAIIPFVLLCVIIACYAKYLTFFIFLAILFLTFLTDARPIEEMSIYVNKAPKLHVNLFDCSKMISNQMYSLNKVAPCKF